MPLSHLFQFIQYLQRPWSSVVSNDNIQTSPTKRVDDILYKHVVGCMEDAFKWCVFERPPDEWYIFPFLIDKNKFKPHYMTLRNASPCSCTREKFWDVCRTCPLDSSKAEDIDRAKQNIREAFLLELSTFNSFCYDSRDVDPDEE